MAMMITDGRACCDCTTCAQGTCLRLIANLEQRLQKRVIVVGSQLLSILQHSNRIPSLDILKAQEEAAALAIAEAKALAAEVRCCPLFRPPPPPPLRERIFPPPFPA